MERAEISVGARLVEGDAELVAGVERARLEEPRIAGVDDRVRLVVLVDPGYRRADGDRHAIGPEGEIVDRDGVRFDGRTLRGCDGLCHAAMIHVLRKSRTGHRCEDRRRDGGTIASHRHHSARLVSVIAGTDSAKEMRRLPRTQRSLSAGTTSGPGPGPLPGAGCG